MLVLMRFYDLLRDRNSVRERSKSQANAMEEQWLSTWTINAL